MGTTESPGTTGTEQETDAVDFLIAQHVAIRDLFREVTESAGAERKAAFERLVRLLAVHETAEEQVVRPVTRRALDGGDAIAEDRIEEERRAKEMLVELEKLGPDSAEFLPLFEQLRQAVLEHAQHEEADEFRYLQQKQETGEPMMAMIRAAEAIAPTHPHPSVNSATANTLTGPVVAMFDRARDLFRKAMG
jgi:hemerythrin superfamily protein